MSFTHTTMGKRVCSDPPEGVDEITFIIGIIKEAGFLEHEDRFTYYHKYDGDLTIALFVSGEKVDCVVEYKEQSAVISYYGDESLRVFGDDLFELIRAVWRSVY